MNNLNEAFVLKTPPSCTTERPKADLIYAIHINDASTHELQFQPYKTTRLKKGGYGVLSSITLDNIHKYGYEERDILIAQLLFAMVMDRYYYTSFTLSGLIGRMIFDQALSTGRTYWTTHKSWDGATARPLTWSDAPREARIGLSWLQFLREFQ